VVNRPTGKTWKPARFIDFVTTPPLGGLVTTEALVKRICQDDETTAIALDEALSRLARLDARQAGVVELKFFAGMSIEEIAEILRISPATVKREWNTAKAWLYSEISS
ncbi:MAG: antiterminator Q family protein, partial [Acidobacteriota bacterium]